MVAVHEFKERHSANVALTIRQLTQQGDKLAHALMAIIDNPKEATSDRLTAIKVAYERGWGRAPIEIHVEVDVTHVMDPLTMEQLLERHRMLLALEAHPELVVVPASLVEPTEGNE